MHPAEAAAPGIPLRTALAGRIVDACQSMRGRRLPFLALAFGAGIAIYFALPVEPSPAVCGAVALAAAVFGALAWIGRGGAGLLALLVAAVLAGLVVAQLRSISVAGPVLGFRYYGPIEGTVLAIDRSGSGAPRITLGDVRLDDVAPVATPHKVRVSLQDGQGIVPEPGARVMTTGHLMPPSGPAEPDGFDFQRHAWFQSLGAVGYAGAPLMLAEIDGTSRPLATLRHAISNRFRARMPGATGEVAAAITTGDRSGLPDDVTEALRASNLAHLLAISGLHMGLLAGFVFWLVRGGLALVPPLALRHPTRAWAAAVVLPFAAFYLALSGGSVATQRAFVMAAVMLVAVMLGRRALSLRSVALAALLVLLVRPESLAGPGFQMSFSATGALVVAFRALSDRRFSWMQGWRGAVIALLLSSVVAGAATAPFAAAHFNRVGQYGVPANMLAVPAMGFLVMPVLLVALLLMPLGIEGPLLAVAGVGIDWILLVADRVAALPGSTGAVQAPGPMVLPMLGAGLTLLIIAWGRGRMVGALILVLALPVWYASPRPDVLISDDGRLVGWMGPEGRYLNRPTGAGFAAQIWLENDGDMATQEIASERSSPDATGLPLILTARGKRDFPDAAAACDGAWLVTPLAGIEPVEGCRIIDADTLRRTGAIALYRVDGGWREVSTVERQGRRPWVPD